MLKVPGPRDESEGHVLMRWWSGDGAARVVEEAAGVLLLERATGGRALAEMARTGADDTATRILCATAARLHAPRPRPLPPLIPLRTWFRALAPAAAVHGGLLARADAEARALLADPREVVPLHGDLHHDNVLDFGPRGWLAIDPNRLIGERGFDFANIFTNPDLADPSRPVATDPARFARRLAIVAEAARLDRRRLVRWILAWTGLSAAWFIEDGDDPAIDLAVGALAAAELDR